MNKLYKNGLLIGKFMPPHKGHELAIQFGINMCENMHVLVGGKQEDKLHVSYRANWLGKTFPTADIKWTFDLEKKPTYDNEGTVIEDWFWNYWIKLILKTFSKIDAVFTNDAYGERLARELDAIWIPIDTDRTVVPISATEIRKDIRKNWKYLNKYAKKYYQTKVVVVGPESTGKSSLVKYLTTAFDAEYIPEYGRILSEVRKNKLTELDFSTIIKGHQSLIEANDSSLLFVDTDSYTTELFMPLYFSNPSVDLLQEVTEQENDDDYDLYIILAPTVNWVNDGTRKLEKQAVRNKFFDALVAYHRLTSKNYIVIDSPNFSVRSAIAQNAVYKLLKDRE